VRCLTDNEPRIIASQNEPRIIASLIRHKSYYCQSHHTWGGGALIRMVTSVPPCPPSEIAGKTMSWLYR
jgi:hypothetical protein